MDIEYNVFVLQGFIHVDLISFKSLKWFLKDYDINDHYMYGRMNALWLNEWMNERKNEWMENMKKWINAFMNKCINA